MSFQTQKSNQTMNHHSKEEQYYKLKRLKESIDADSLLETLGFDISSSNHKEVRAACKVHGGDNKTSFRMNKDTKNWVCFSHGCQEETGYDVISLVMCIMGLSFQDTVKYLESITGVNIHDESSYIEFKRGKERREFIQQNFDNRQVPSALVNEEYLQNFKKFRSNYFEKKGYPVEVLSKFEVGGGYVDKYGFQRDVIPIRNVNNELKAYSCRDITGKADYDYKYLLTKGFDKDKVLYNLHRAKDYMGNSRILIVVEGFKSVWKLFMAGYKNVVACMGSRITNGQQNLLYSNAFNVILLFDADEPGLLGLNHALEDMRGKINMIPIFIPYTGKDPSDLTVEELKQLLGGNYG